MIKAEKLKRGDKVAIVSLSKGILGETQFIHKFYLGKKRLEEKFGLEVIAMPNALKGIKYLYENPQKRAEDLMNAFKDKSIKAIICAIGGNDTIRILPYIDFNIIKNNPKIFIGYSDSTANHFMMYKAGLNSFYGPALMTDFAEYGDMYEYTENCIKELLFENPENYEIKKCDYWINDFIPWDEKNINIHKKRTVDTKGYEILQGKGKVTGELLGGCIEVLIAINGTDIWVKPEDWKNKILFIETSDNKIPPEYIEMFLRNLGAQGILKNINGILVGKTVEEKYYEEYKEKFISVMREFNREDLPIIYNMNFGHNIPIGIIPYGINCEVDVENKKIKLLEKVLK